MQRDFWDISAPVSEALARWPESEGLSHTQVHELAAGARVNESTIALGSHVGTHIDAPLHFLAGGASVDQLPLDALVGHAAVVEVEAETCITAEELQQKTPAGTERLLIRSRNSAFWPSAPEFTSDYVSISVEAAQWIVAAGIKLVGIDYLSVERFDGDGDVHRTLLGANVVVVEGLVLNEVFPGSYWLACLPINITGSEGAPARAVLMRPPPEGDLN